MLAAVGDEVATRRDVQGATVCRTPFKRLIISIRCSTLPFLRFVILIRVGFLGSKVHVDLGLCAAICVAV